MTGTKSAWDRAVAWMDTAFAPFGRPLLAAAACEPGHRVLDVGCGTGAVTSALAGQVGEAGRVVAVDIAASMCAATRRVTTDAGLSQVSVVHADAATVAFPHAPFDRIVSRFGTMFFPDPVAAFGHLRSALAANGTITIMTFAPRDANQWTELPTRLLARHLPPGASVDANAPAFSQSDPARLADLLRGAGCVAVDSTTVVSDVVLGGGGGLDAATDHLLTLEGPARILNRLPEAARAAARAELRAELVRHLRPDGTVRLAGTAILTTARGCVGRTV